MTFSRLRILLAAVALTLIVAVTIDAAEEASPQFDAQQLEFFEKDIRPILANRCFECHGPEAETPGGGLYLTSRAAILEGGDSGASIVVGKPDESLLIEAIHYDGIYQMPPKSRMPEDEIAKLEKWVATGAAWPPGEDNTPKKEVFDLEQRKADHWAWQPVTRPALPTVKNETWAKDPLDRFILAKLEEANLSPNSPADQATLLRRVYFDLTGMPPTREQLEAYLSDPSPEALAQVVDQLLASPRFGEHWGRHWLDLVRYAESRGHEFDYDIPNAFEYRDYVIRSLNADIPYNELVIEHIAGDLLAQPRVDAQTGFNESVLGTGFWHMGDWVHSPVDIRKDETDRFDNMLDVMNKAFLGLTVTCARCHDHKFDAISQADYYAQMGFLQSSAYRQVRFETEPHNQRIAQSLEKLNTEFQQKAKAIYRQQVSQVSGQWEKELTQADSVWAAELEKARKDQQHPLHYWAMAIQGEGQPSETQLTSEVNTYSGQIINDFSQAMPGQWRVDGFVFGAAPQPAGQFVWAKTEQPEVAGVRTETAAVFDTRWEPLKLQNGVQDDFGRIRNWNRAGRTLKSNTFTLSDGLVHYLVKGSVRAFAVVDSHRLVQGPLHGVVCQEFKTDHPEQLRWVTHNLRDYQGHTVHIELSPIDGLPAEIYQVAEGTAPPPLPSAQQAAAASFQTAVAQGGSPAALLVKAFSEASDNSQYAPLADWLVRNWTKVMPGDANPLNALAQQYRDATQPLFAEVKWRSRTAPGMWDNSAESERLLIRGNARNPADLIERRMLTAIAGNDHQFDTVGSGRLELARQMMQPDNPFASRVAVNRIWHYLMGRGIVRTVDNFGVLGQAPTHPELLDYLATEFVADGWSLKRMVRRVVLSQTYQMSSVQEGAAEELDPKNDLFHRAEVKRLSGESIRDSLLMISGRLDETMFGPSVPVHLTAFMQGRGRPGQSGPLDGAGRRSIYLSIRRNFLSPMMLAFDTPQPITTIGRRNQSNVPAQSLILLNDPMVLEQCHVWAQRAIQETPDDASLRFERMVEQAFSRKPTDAERSLAAQFLETHGQTISVDPGQQLASVELWRDLAHVLINAKSFVFVR
ncbi:PSD1 and planctomycete cytochrome C domain-containing protein [Bremerella cremea]|uniref:PSD1 and planctomycete cytochrome C domain-containing protein n=1 Tax=Bremerella cremea TaxID=1031537 RepID=UPI0031EA21FF